MASIPPICPRSTCRRRAPRRSMSRLKIGQVSTSVTVTANPLLNATDTTNGYTLDKQQIALTPLATGSFTQLAVLAPGVNAELLSGLEHECRTGQPADLGERPARYLEYLPGERRRRRPISLTAKAPADLPRSGTTSTLAAAALRPLVRGCSDHWRRQSRREPQSMARTATACLLRRLSLSRRLRVNTSMYDAQQGATSGAQIDVEHRNRQQ